METPTWAASQASVSAALDDQLVVGPAVAVVEHLAHHDVVDRVRRCRPERCPCAPRNARLRIALWRFAFDERFHDVIADVANRNSPAAEVVVVMGQTAADVQDRATVQVADGRVNRVLSAVLVLAAGVQGSDVHAKLHEPLRVACRNPLFVFVMQHGFTSISTWTVARTLSASARTSARLSPTPSRNPGRASPLSAALTTSPSLTR